MASDYGTSLNIAHIESGSYIYGPGKRFVAWFQGCSLRCPGCWNREMWSTQPKILIEREDLVDQIICDETIDGVTFLGGEPLQQSDNLFWLFQQLKERGVHIMLYTGYEEDEIAENPIFSSICLLADILIPGRYHDDERDINLQWRGSRNQKVLIRDGISHYSDGINQLEIVIDENGSVRYLGYPDDSIEDMLL